MTEHDRDQGKEDYQKLATTLVKATGQVGMLPTAGRQEFAARGLRRCFTPNATRGRSYPIHRKNAAISRLHVTGAAVHGPHPRGGTKPKLKSGSQKNSSS